MTHEGDQFASKSLSWPWGSNSSWSCSSTMLTSSTLSCTEGEAALAFNVPTASLWLRYVRSWPLMLSRISPDGKEAKKRKKSFSGNAQVSWLLAAENEGAPLLIRPSRDKQPCGWTLVTKIGSSPLLLPRPPATVMPRDSRGSFFTVMCFSLHVTHWDRSWETSEITDSNVSSSS